MANCIRFTERETFHTNLIMQQLFVINSVTNTFTRCTRVDVSKYAQCMGTCILVDSLCALGVKSAISAIVLIYSGKPFMYI